MLEKRKNITLGKGHISDGPMALVNVKKEKEGIKRKRDKGPMRTTYVSTERGKV